MRPTSALLLLLVAACTQGDRLGPNELPVSLALSQPTATVLLQESFEDNAFASRGWYDNTSLTTTTAQHAAGSTRALESHFLAGATTPTFGGSARHLFPATPTLYVGYQVKYSANWIGSGHPYHPHQFLILSDQDGDWDGPSNNWLTAYIEDVYQNGGIPRLALQDNKAINTTFGALPVNLINLTENRSIGGCNGVVESGMFSECFNMPPWYNDKQLNAASVAFQPNPGPGYKGDWNQVEVYLQMNSVSGGIGQADGVMQYWFNGVLMIDRHDVLFRTGARPNIQFHQFLIAPYIGDGSPVDQYMWVDNLTLATARTVDAPATAPGTVTGLSVAAVTANSVTLSFIEANDGTGQPAQYDIRSAPGTIVWGSATEVSQGTCQTPVVGTAIGAVRTCTVLGLAPSTSYQFQLIPFRGTLNVNAVFGAPSNTASGTTTAGGTTTPVASVALSPASASLVAAATRQFTASLKSAGGTALTGRTVTWTSSNPAVATTSASGLVTGVKAGTAAITATSEGKSGTATVTVTTPTTKPGTVTNAAVAAVTSNSVTLSFTEVTGGTGLPARYEVRWTAGTMSWGSAKAVTQGTCKAPLAGVAIGAARTCTVQGLTPSTIYQFQLRAFRGTLNVNAVFGALSNVVSGTTTGAAAAPVAMVSVSPGSANLLGGSTQLLSVTLKDASGNTLTGRTVTWASSAPLAATVGANGLVTGLVAGASTITATCEGKNGSAAVTVTAPAPGGTWPNEPGGFTLLTDYRFTDPIPLVKDGVVGLGWNVVNPDNGQPAVLGHAATATDPTAPMGSTVADFIYPVGMGGGWAPATMYFNHVARQEIYAGFWWKPSSSWQNHPSGVNKIAFWLMGNYNISIQMYGPAPYKLHVQTEVPNEVVRYVPNATSTPITLGVWHRIEVHMTMAGLLEFWLDGVLQGRYTGVNTSGTPGFTMFSFSPTWGGMNALKTQTDHYLYNAVHLSGR